jgi:hypothetical protein
MEMKTLLPVITEIDTREIIKLMSHELTIGILPTPFNFKQHIQHSMLKSVTRYAMMWYVP